MVEQPCVVDEFHGEAFAAHGGAVDFDERAQFLPVFAGDEGVVHDGVGDEPLALADGVGHFGGPVEGAVFVPEPAGVGGEG